jgi:hypothetical protein
MRMLLLLVTLSTPAWAATGVDEAAARGLLTDWLAAQNSGNAKAYGGLYAGRFFGVKRVGRLSDRGRMFKRKMRVEAGDVRVSWDGRSAVVRFIQTWASGSFKDVGPKQLVLVREAGEVRIAREEMLASKRVGEAAAPALDPERFAFVVGDDGARWMLLSAVRKMFRREGGKGAWELYECMKPKVSSFTFGGRNYVAVSGESGPGCGGFYGSFWALFGSTPDGKLQLLTDPNDPGDLFHPTSVMDFDGDGVPEFLAPGRLVRQVGAMYRPTDEAVFPSFDCPC